MTPEILGIIGIVAMMILLGARMWNASATALIGFLGIVLIKGWPQALNAAGQAPYYFIAKYDMAVLPMFVLMGMVVSQAGIGADLYYTMDKWFGHMRGGLAVATTWACAAFGAITGMSVSAIVVMSKVALPEMRKYKYDDRLSTGTIAASSTMGILIPPSIAFVMYGILTEQSIGKLFLAGIIPGILEAAFYMITIYLLCRFNPRMGPPGPKTTTKEKIGSLHKTWPVMALFLLIMGGIYFGIFTPTEAGAIGAFGAIVVTIIRRQFSSKGFLSVLLDTGVMTAMILFLLMGAALFQKFVAASELAFLIGDLINAFQVSRVAVMAVIVIVFLILGCFLPAMLTLILTIPILYPVILAMGFDPIWFGVIMVRMIEIGGLTPPLGIDCFVLSGVSGVPLGTIFRGVVPFVIADAFHVAALIAFPILSLYIPTHM